MPFFFCLPSTSQARLDHPVYTAKAPQSKAKTKKLPSQYQIASGHIVGVRQPQTEIAYRTTKDISQ